jgi:hypothetical protein
VCFYYFPSKEENNVTTHSLDVMTAEANSRKQNNFRRHMHVIPAQHTAETTHTCTVD